MNTLQKVYDHVRNYRAYSKNGKGFAFFLFPKGVKPILHSYSQKLTKQEVTVLRDDIVKELVAKEQGCKYSNVFCL